MGEQLGRRLFKIGIALLILIGLTHSLSLFRDLAPANDTEKQLIALMTQYNFNLMGSMRSMDNLFRGFSISFMLAAFGIGAPRSGPDGRTFGTPKTCRLHKCDLSGDDGCGLPAIFLYYANVVFGDYPAGLCPGLAKITGCIGRIEVATEDF
jgi:hypothetical protein